MIIPLIFSIETNRGITAWRDPVTGEYSRLLDVTLIGDFFNTPSRYQWTGTALIEYPGWVDELAAAKLAADQKIMRDAIKGKESTKNSRKIEHPDISGAFFEPSDKIQRTLDRYDDLVNTYPLPINGGCWDDIDEKPVPMTIGKLKKLRNAIVDREDANFLVRKNHIKAMKLLADPLTYDYSGGWA